MKFAKDNKLLGDSNAEIAERSAEKSAEKSRKQGQCKAVDSLHRCGAGGECRDLRNNRLAGESACPTHLLVA